MSLFSMALVGSTPIGGPIVGWIGEHIDPRAAVLLGGIAALVAAMLRRAPPRAPRPPRRREQAQLALDTVGAAR